LQAILTTLQSNMNLRYSRFIAVFRIFKPVIFAAFGRRSKAYI